MSDKAILLKSNDFFNEVVSEAFEQRGFKTFPLMHNYVSDLLVYFMRSENLFEKSKNTGKKVQPTLAELYFKAMGSEREERQNLLKKLGDTSLYVSGIFGDSLQSKVVDVDYYASMGTAAYSTLSEEVNEDLYKRLYDEIGSRFIEVMEVLTIISQKAFIQDNTNLLRLYDRYLKTGSDLAKQHLLEKGLLQLPEDKKRGYNQ